MKRDNNSSLPIAIQTGVCTGSDELLTVFAADICLQVLFKVKADSDEESEEKAFRTLTDPAGEYVKKYGPAFEAKRKHVWRFYY